MRRYIVSPQAVDDLFEIWCYLAEHAGVDTANRVEDEIYAAFESLARMPGQGHRRPDLTSHPVLFVAVYSYMIVFRRKDPLEIVGVLHAKRNLEDILKQR